MDSANCIGALLTDGQVFTTVRECHSCDTLTAFDTRDESLHLLVYIVDDDVMTTGVAKNIVFKIEDVVLDIILETKQEPRLNCHVHRVLLSSCSGRLLVALHHVAWGHRWLLLGSCCLYHDLSVSVSKYFYFYLFNEFNTINNSNHN